MPGSVFYFYLLLNMDIIHIIIAITIITAITPTAAPALKIPLITEHPLKATIAKAKNNKLSFFISRLMFNA
jgi:hypothetical protein